MTNISLTVLGAGTMVPTKTKNPAGFLVKAGNTNFLLDAGPGTMRHLTDYNYNIQDVDIIFISHFHTDHFGDAFNLVHSRWVDDNYNKRKNKKITFLCPKETQKRFKLWRKIFWVEPNETYPIKFLEGPRKLKIKNIEIEIFPVKHVKWFSSVGIIIKRKNKKIVYTGDIGSKHNFNDLLKKASNADLLITEASYEKPTPNHYTIKQIKTLVDKAKVKKVLIVHVRPQQEKRVEKIYSQNPKFILGKDKMKLKIYSNE